MRLKKIKEVIEMKIYKNIEIKETKTGLKYKLKESEGEIEITKDDPRYKTLKDIYTVCKDSESEEQSKNYYNSRITDAFSERYRTKDYDPDDPRNILIPGVGSKTVQQLVDFFKEFEFQPNLRFVNTIGQMAKVGRGGEYAKNYFALSDSPYQTQLASKVVSPEFKDMMKKLAMICEDYRINRRLKIYFGPQGTGKTTQAMKETGGRVVPCHSAILPSDIMEDFDFERGDATFKPSAFAKAMENGESITLDEINLLPFDTLRFLQTLLDNKDKFIYKGRTININDGFMVIGTMNLKVNGSVYSLPEPLIDRCADIVEYIPTIKMLERALYNPQEGDNE